MGKTDSNGPIFPWQISVYQSVDVKNESQRPPCPTILSYFGGSSQDMHISELQPAKPWLVGRISACRPKVLVFDRPELFNGKLLCCFDVATAIYLSAFGPCQSCACGCGSPVSSAHAKCGPASWQKSKCHCVICIKFDPLNNWVLPGSLTV